MTVAQRTRPAEQLSEGLFALGGAIPLDGRVSWAPEQRGRYQPINCYVLLAGTDVLLIDTGIAAHRELILEQLARIVAPGRSLSIFLTRPEFDAIGNLAAVSSAYTVTTLYTGGVTNPFDAFDYAAASGISHGRVDVSRKQPGEELILGSGRRLQVISPALKILATYWLYDPASRTLFSSDSFGYTSVADPDASRILDDPGARADRADVESHLYMKYGWLRSATTGSIVRFLRDTFAKREVGTLAPAHGVVLRGPGPIASHLETLIGILSH